MPNLPGGRLAATFCDVPKDGDSAGATVVPVKAR